jgi:glutamyl-tRNA synthetase
MIRVRFAPSPTGHLHVGGARTALFNWLLARKSGGSFVLRIEDTDRQRSRAEYTEGIFASMRWLGLDWDEGPDIGGPHAPYTQSEREEGHREAALRLLSSGHAYRCFCEAGAARSEGEGFRADTGGPRCPGDCRSLSPEEADARLAAAGSSAIRFRVPGEGAIAWEDLIRGEVSFACGQIDDFVLMKSDGSATYLLGAAADDLHMGITHIIRGEDHIANTPKQILLFRAFGAEPPRFGHLPLILGPDKSRLSKRHGATAVFEYRDRGILPLALVNYLALLGWSPPDGREVLTCDELIAAFDIGRVGKTGSVFDFEKLLWLNGQQIALLPVPERTALAIPFLVGAGLITEVEAARRGPWLEEVVALLGDRVKSFDQVPGLTDFLFRDEIEWSAETLAKVFGREGMAGAVDAVAEGVASLESFTVETVERVIRETATARGIGAGKLIGAIRVSVSGREVTPPLFETIVLLGRERAVSRIREAVRLACCRNRDEE